MLALDVNLLTAKLQKQTLRDGESAASNIQLINPDTGFKLSESAQAKLGASGQGQKLWTVTMNSRGSGETSSAECPPEDDSAPCCPTKVLCSHKKLQHLCSQCDSNKGGTERPKKRHCRSMSVPQETEINIPPAKSTWQPQGSGLWKPIAVGCPDRKWDVRSVHWSPTHCRNYEFSSLAQSGGLRHGETGHITPDDLLTPPESPVPRPNSVYSDGAISPFTGDVYGDYMNKVHQVPEFRIRSLSLEDKISCTHGSFSGSVSNVCGMNSSMPSSPHHRRIPRCRSQPSFYDRKSGRRRRRDLRPTLNFNKMTETAYWHQKKTDPLATSKTDQLHSSLFHDTLESVMSLMPIASSPRDTDQATFGNRKSPSGSPIHELEYVNRDNVSVVTEEDSRPLGPVKLLGEEEDETDMEVFQLTEELDLEQIENH